MYKEDIKTMIIKGFKNENGTLEDITKGGLLFLLLSIALSVFFFSAGTFIFFLGTLLIANLELALTWLPFVKAENDGILFFKFIIFLASVMFGFMCISYWVREEL